MDNRVYLSNLYDYYKCLLTDKQCSYFEDYYFDNLTMEEIAENNDVSKNAISKSLIEVKDRLEDYENKLNLYANRKKILEILDENTFEKISDYV